MKKQIAVLMAAATAVTTVAPVLASADVNNYDASTSEVVKKITDALNTRYKDKTANGITASNADVADAYMNSVYAVAISVPKGQSVDTNKYDVVALSSSKYNNTSVATAFVDAFKDEADKAKETTADETAQVTTNDIYIVRDASKVQGLIENLVIGKNQDVKVAIVAKGVKDGAATEVLTDKHYVVGNVNDTDTEVSLKTLADELSKEAGKPVTYVDKHVVTYNNNKKDVTKVKLTLKSGKEYTLEANDKAFDLNKPLNKNGQEVDLTNANAQNVLDTIEGFKFEENHDGKEATVLLPLGDTTVYTVQDVMTSSIELGKIFGNKEGYTKNGADFVNSIIDARNPGSHQFNYNGVNYTIVKEDGTKYDKKDSISSDDAFFDNNNVNNNLKPKIEKDGDSYTLRVNVRVQNENSGLKPVTLQFVIKGDNQKDLAIVLSNLENENNVVAGHFTRLQGANRYATAIAVSQENYSNPQSANTVVIVGGEALMDGLSAVPLAKAKNAPILLANPKTGLDDATLNEISRVTKDLNRKTVYVVGGKNSVPESVVKQLEDKFGAVVLRVSGSDRYDTSLEVAKRLGYDGDLGDTVKKTVSEIKENYDNALETKKTNDANVTKLQKAFDDALKAYKEADEAFAKNGADDDGTLAKAKTDATKVKADAETSLELAKKDAEKSNSTYDEAKKAYQSAEKKTSTVIETAKLGNIYIVGGDGAADAMSISPVAASVNNGKVSPILVVPKTGLKRSTRDFIKNFEGKKFLIGGESVLSSDVYRDINGSKVSGDVSRISGSNRFDTNVQIIKEFYGTAPGKMSVNGAIFTSGDNKYLVDAQTAGPLATTKNAPIVLTGSKLTDDQVNLLKKNGVLDGVKTNVYQVGGVVSSDVMSVVVDKLGL